MLTTVEVNTSRRLAVNDFAAATPSAPDPLRVAHQWPIDDVPELAGRDDVSRRVVELRRMDDTMPGSKLLPFVLEEVKTCRCPRLSAELYQLAGWIVSDLGQRDRARSLYMTGVEAARQAGDRALAAQLLSCLAYQDASAARSHDALLLARTAAKGAEGAVPPLAEALFKERVAWSAARVGAADVAKRSLEEVESAYSRHVSGTTEAPDWTYWLDRAEIDVMASRCMIELGKPGDAAPLLKRAVDNYPPEHSREIALYLTWLAEGYARVGDLDAAESTLHQAAELHVESDRIGSRLEHVSQLMSA